MTPRLIAWAVLATLTYGAVHAWTAWRNPWTLPTAASIVHDLPPMPAGCGEGCK